MLGLGVILLLQFNSKLVVLLSSLQAQVLLNQYSINRQIKVVKKYLEFFVQREYFFFSCSPGQSVWSIVMVIMMTNKGEIKMKKLHKGHSTLILISP